MDPTTLAASRQGLCGTFSQAADALFEVADALLTAPQAQAFIELSQAPGCRRGWPSRYAAFRDGRIDRAALRRVFTRHAPAPAPGARLVLGLDPSPIHRPEAATFADRTPVYAPNLPAGVAPTRPGWACSTLAVLPEPVSSWTDLLETRRVPSSETATTVGAAQLAAVPPLLPARPIVTADGHDGTAKWVAATAALPCDQLLRAKRTAVLDRPAPPRTGKRGAPRKDGPRFQGSAPATHGATAAQWAGADARGRAVSVAHWGGLHLKARRDVSLTAIRIVRAGAADTKRDRREAWCWWLGGPLPPLASLPRLCARRWRVEQAVKLVKRHLGLHLFWSAKPVVVQQQVWATLCIAQILHALQLEIAGRAGVDPCEVSLALLVAYLPRLARVGPDPLAVFVERGRELGFIRPSTRTVIRAPTIAPERLAPLPPGLALVRPPRYAQRKCGPRPRPSAGGEVSVHK